jgi:hypothetical protein
VALLATQPISRSSRRRTRSLNRAFEYWHLLSLDAPSVATLWAFSFARALHITLPAASLLLLFAGTWLLYVADRILDGLRPTARLRDRHVFYIRHRAAVLAAAIPVSIFLAWLCFAHMLPAARRDDLILFAAAAAYFFLVHLRGRSIERWFPKELVVALIFASATAVPAYVRITLRPEPTSVFHATPIANHFSAVLRLLATLFAALCWLNCVAIEKWETLAGPIRPTQRRDSPAQMANPTARWAQHHLRRISVAITLSALAGAVLLLRSNSAAAELCSAAGLSSALFLALDRAPLSPFHLRIAADAALLTPLLLFLIR